MKYGALLGWGIVIYAIMSLLWSGLVIYGIAATPASLFIRLCALILLATIAGRSLRFHLWKDILPYSIFWAIMMAALDAVYTVPFSGWAMYQDWYLWVGYGLVAAVPLLAPLLHQSPREHQT